jgi:hypothetical protein
MELSQLQKQLNYHVNQPILIFLTDKKSTVNALSLPNQIASQGSGGLINLEQKPAIIHSTMSEAQIRFEFRKAAAGVLIDEMMNGGTLQDKVRNANLIHLPEWVVPGLIFYLADQWSLETDNIWRVIHDEQGLKKFNAIPNHLTEIKGASIWKYVVYKYGENSISTILYMARLTRKFNAALFYAYQISMNDVYKGALDYFNDGYEIDQKKPNPIHGLQMNSNELLDLLIINQNLYYSLEKTIWGVVLYENNLTTKTKKKIYILGKDEFPNNKFSGSILSTSNSIYLVLNTKNGVDILSSVDDFETKQRLSLAYVSDCITVNKTIYMLQSGLDNSQIWKWDGVTLQKVRTISQYVESFSVFNSHLAYATYKGGASYIVIQNLENEYSKSISLANESIKQVIWANDSVLLFNSSKNGIWNGKLLNVNQGTIRYVTNYRSNIGFHFYSNEVFVEYLERGEHSSLFLADYIPTDEFYTYDSLEHSFFSIDIERNNAAATTKPKTEIDSLEHYTFQSPINPVFDFKLSNYDSLVKVEASRNNLSASEILAPDIIKPTELVVKLNNDLMINNQVSFVEQVPTLTPNNINVRLSSLFKNQFNTKELQILFSGFIQRGAQDIGLIYSKRGNWNSQLSGLHRQRLMFADDMRYKYLTDVLGAQVSRQVCNPIEIRAALEARSNRSTRLAIDQESLSFPGEHILYSTLSLGAKFNVQHANTSLKADFTIAPQLLVNQSRFNTTSQLRIEAKRQLNYWASISIKSHFANSIGAAPNVFTLGGSQYDVLSNYFNRPFGTNVQPSLIHLIYGVRGFDLNYRNGTSIGLANFDVELKPLNLFFSRAISSEVFANFKLTPFFDMATSFYGRNIYDVKNNLNKRIISSSTGTIVAEVNAFKNPFIYSYGVGIGTQIYNYRVRLDYALGREESNTINRMFHLSFGLPL